MLNRQAMLSELNFLKNLFFENLPIGDKKQEIEEYFSCLEKAIYTNEPIQREEFPPDDTTTSGDRVYKYHSAAAFKELASRHIESSSGQDMDHSQSQQADLSTTPDFPPASEIVAHIQERPERRDTDSDGRIDDPNFCGELDRGCPCELCNGNVQDP